MFYYYGSKSKLLEFYPKPKYETIVEPFAGSAKYSLKYWDRNVILVDKYDVVISIWKWLQKCSINDILKLPKLKAGQVLDSLNWDCEEAKLFVGFIIGAGSTQPRNKVTKMHDWDIMHTPNLYKNIASNLHKIRHWEIKLGCYKDIENIEATWFIDPPYQFGGEAYKVSSKLLDFNNLATFCKERNGQIIVCENTKASWLPFLPLAGNNSTVSANKTIEAIWTNYNLFLGNQLSIF